MTIKECIDIVDNLKPNQYLIEDKVDWLTFLDMKIINDVLKTHEGYDGRYDDFLGYSPDNLSTALVVPSPYDRLYTAYLKMKIDEENGETARYNNSATMFNSYLMEYKKWYNKTHMPLSVTDNRIQVHKPSKNLDVTEAQMEALRKLLYAELHDDMLAELSDDKIRTIVTAYMQTNAQMLKGKDGLDGANGKDGLNGKDGMDGANGIGIQKAWIEGNELFITLTSGVTQNLGVVVGKKGEKGDKGEQGESADSYVIVNDFTNITQFEECVTNKFQMYYRATQSDFDNLIYEDILIPFASQDFGNYYFIAYSNGYELCVMFNAGEWEKTYKEIGGSGDLSEYVKKTDYATADIGGVVKAKINYGIFVEDGMLKINRANNSHINARSGDFYPITPVTIDYAVKKALADCKLKDADAWTDEEKASARDLLGVTEQIGNIETIITELHAYAESLKGGA